MTVIVMTREMGSRGKEVADILAERLSASLVYHEVRDDSEGHAAGPSEVRRHLDGANGNGHAKAGNGRMTPLEILEIAGRGNVILRGWGAVRVLAGIPHVLAARVCAPMEARVAEMARRIGVSEARARREIERSDAAHTGLFERLFGGNWCDPLNYDVVLSTARTEPERCAGIILDLAARPDFEETVGSRQVLADRLAAARITAFLTADPGMRRAARNVHVSVTGNAVRLYGNVRGDSVAREVAAAVRAREGAMEVRDELQTTAAYAYY